MKAKIGFLCLILNCTIFSQNINNNYFLKDNLSGEKPFHLNNSHIEKFKWYKTFTDIPSDFTGFINKSFSHQNLPTLLGITFITASLINLDQRTWEQTRLNYNKYSSFKKLSEFSVSLGDGKYHFLLAGIFSAYGLLTQDETAVKTASNVTEAVLATGLFVQILKRISGRETPIKSNKSAGEWNFFPNLKEYQNNQPKFFSFPSGHVATAAATVTVIANNYPEIKWIKPAGYSLIGLIGIGLVGKGWHWYSDLPLGFFIGYSFGNLISPSKEKKEIDSFQKDEKHFFIIPNYSNRNFGIQLGFSF